MTDAERRQLIRDLTALSDTVWSAIPAAQGEQLAQLLELAERSDEAIAELEHRPAHSPTDSQIYRESHSA